LAIRFNQRRSGQEPLDSKRSTTRRYPPMFETHPYVRRDDTERRSAVRQVKDEQGRKGLPGEPWFSDTLARKRIAGQNAKRDRQNTDWYKPEEWLNWEPGKFESWVNKFERSLKQNSRYCKHPHYQNLEPDHKEARSLREIGNASKGFVAYIYADGNNMGGYIQKIKNAEEYQSFSDHVFKATETCVYRALEEHLEPHQLFGIDDAETQGRDGKWIHPFEILTIGGDDVMLVVPANKALQIAKTLSEQFELLLLERQDPKFYLSEEEAKRPQDTVHRYKPQNTELPVAQCKLSMSAGVLITAQDMPIYYARNLVGQLLKSAKKYSKQLQPELPKPGQTDPDYFYPGGTVDFLVMKSVTMLSSKVGEFRESGLVIDGKPKLKLYGAPYTLHEVGGLIETVKALKAADFPRSQLYQIRSFLEQGKNTAMLNYRYFWSRLKNGVAKQELKEQFEKAWCEAKTNGGNLVPWMYVQVSDEEKRKPNYVATYETIWRELVDLYPFIDEEEQTEQEQSPAMSTSTNREEA
jgi:CRISPR-associated protein Cmr2